LSDEDPSDHLGCLVRRYRCLIGESIPDFEASGFEDEMLEFNHDVPHTFLFAASLARQRGGRV
jgi:hypothetical protein